MTRTRSLCENIFFENGEWLHGTDVCFAARMNESCVLLYSYGLNDLVGSVRGLGDGHDTTLSGRSLIALWSPFSIVPDGVPQSRISCRGKKLTKWITWMIICYYCIVSWWINQIHDHDGQKNDILLARDLFWQPNESFTRNSPERNFSINCGEWYIQISPPNPSWPRTSFRKVSRREMCSFQVVCGQIVVPAVLYYVIVLIERNSRLKAEGRGRIMERSMPVIATRVLDTKIFVPVPQSSQPPTWSAVENYLTRNLRFRISTSHWFCRNCPDRFCCTHPSLALISPSFA